MFVVFYKRPLCVPFVMYCEGFVVFTCKIHCLQTCEHNNINVGWNTKL